MIMHYFSADSKGIFRLMSEREQEIEILSQGLGQGGLELAQGLLPPLVFCMHPVSVYFIVLFLQHFHVTLDGPVSWGAAWVVRPI